MKTKNRIPVGFALTLLLSTLNSQPSFAQGSLTPPGSPAPTMKTLTQIEPRTPISTNSTPGDGDSLFRITQPGSYYLTTNLTGVAAKHGIEIAASGVTLDLMGFELAGGVTNSLDGVRVSVTTTNIAVRNGSVRNWGGNGVHADFAKNGQYHDLRLSANGGRGLICGDGSAVVKCTAQSNGGDGIYAGDSGAISGCTAQDNQGTHGIHGGIGSTISVCTAQGNQVTYGIFGNIGSTISGCAAYANVGTGSISYGIYGTSGITIIACVSRSNSNTNSPGTSSHGIGIFAGGASTVKDCSASFNRGDGIRVSNDSLVEGNTCNLNGNSGVGAGIHVTSIDNRIEGNNSTDNDLGFDVDVAGNLIIRNSASGNITDWDIVANNVFGPILDRRVPASAPVLGFTAPSSLGTNDANANFSY